MLVKAPEIEAAAVLRDRPDPAAIDAFQRAGAVIVRGLIPPHWIGALREQYDHWADKAAIPYSDRGPNAQSDALTVKLRTGVWEAEEGFRNFVFQSPIARAAAALMRSETAMLFEDLMLMEPKGAKGDVNWHQDGPSWPVTGQQRANVWFSLESVGPESGGMRFVQGSHLGPMYLPANKTKPPEADEDMWAGEPFPDVATHPERFPIIVTNAEPGDAVIFHPLEIHTAYGASPDHARRTFTIRFLGDDVRWLPKKYLFHAWMHDLGLNKGDKIVSPRLPIVWDATAA
jgi:ectoine hydroxylase-related dioxygenase (phytanoyl-CoA dioxygenase family)